MSLNDYKKRRKEILQRIVDDSDWKNLETKEAFTPNPESQAAMGAPGGPPGGPPPPPAPPGDPMMGGDPGMMGGDPTMGGGAPPLPDDLAGLFGMDEAEAPDAEPTIEIPISLFEKFMDIIHKSTPAETGETIKSEEGKTYGEADLVDELHKEIEYLKEQQKKEQETPPQPAPGAAPAPPPEEEIPPIQPPAAHGGQDIAGDTEQLIASLME